ncbi:MAG: tetratricopeptide repeat protein [Chthonomonas sp.]|nr:tetratricopeptide repeat protein [Chthonomonas sp.]
MNPEYQKIVDLFGLAIPQAEQEETDSALADSPDNLQELAEASLLQGDYDRAARHFRKVLETQPKESLSARRGLATALECLGQSPQAVRQFSRIIRENGGDMEASLALGEIYAREGRTSEGLAHLEEAVKLEPENPFPYLKLAEELRRRGYRERALRAIQGAVLFAPDQSFYHYWMGDILLELGRFDEALAAFRAAIELSPGDDYFYIQASLAFWATGRPLEAIKAVRMATDLEPDKLWYRVILAEYLHKQGQTDEAEIELKAAKEVGAYERENLRRLFKLGGLSH